MQDSIRTNEQKNTNAHDERTEDLQPIRVQIPAEIFNTADQITLITSLHNEKSNCCHCGPLELGPEAIVIQCCATWTHGLES